MLSPPVDLLRVVSHRGGRLVLTLSAIADHFGPEDWRKDGIEHFFRPLRRDAVIVRDMVKSGHSAKDFFDNKAVS
jgi:hypothetical protein